MSDVPSEILQEILSKLPVAPLLRFRCVCKQWKCLIDSNDLLKEHLDHSRKSNSHLNIIIMRDDEELSVDFDLLNETNRVTFQLLSHPLKTPDCDTLVLGSCDGLLALSNTKDIIFWNPYARRFHKFHKLPVTGFDFSECDAIAKPVYGFGYDFVSNDYKLVEILQFFRVGSNVVDSETKVYNLKSDSWRKIPDFPYLIKRILYGELVNGALHWLVNRKEKPDTNSLLAAFDLGTEEYRLVPLPEYACSYTHMTVVVLGGCLSITCSYYMNCVDLWVMKEYGVKESWSILFTLKLSDISFLQFDLLRPIEYSKCGRKVLVLLDGHFLMWYDLDKNSTDLPAIERPINNCYMFYPCLQSLVLLNSGTCDYNIVAEKKQKRKNKRRGKKKKKGGSGEK